MIRHRGLEQSVVIALALAIAAAAQEYSFRFYGSAEGLQNLVVLSLAQDRQGFNWAGTEGGLYRYDGTRFRLMGQEEGLPCSTEVHGLFVASDGALWANACTGIFRREHLITECSRRLVQNIDWIMDGLRSLLPPWTPWSLPLFRETDGGLSELAV